MNQIKVKFDLDYSFYNERLVYKTLLDNYEVKEVENFFEADLIIAEKINSENKKWFFDERKKTIFVSHENILFRRSLFSLIEKIFSGLGFKKQKYKILDFLDRITPKFIASISFDRFMEKEFQYVKKIQNNELKNSYAIVCNNFKHKNILEIPLFIRNDFYKIKDYLKKEIPSKEDWESKEFCAFIVSSNASRERIDFFKKLSKYKKVDSHGRVFNNVGPKFIGKNWRNNSEIFKNYKFVICFENSFEDEYITEKLPNVFLSNSIGIYRGAPNTPNYFNTKSFINYNGSYSNMIKKIIELDRNYESYLEMLKEPCFKNNKIPEIIKNKENEVKEFYGFIFSK